MRKWLVMLSLACIALLAASIYLARELRAVRVELASARASPGVPAAPAASLEKLARPVSAAPVSSGIAQADAPANPPRTAEEFKALARAWAVKSIPEWRQIVEDSAKREAFLRDNKEGFRSTFPQIAKHLGLTDDEYSRLANLLADQQLRMLEARYQCAIKPICDDLAISPMLEPEFQRELVELLGAETRKRFEDYRDNMQERYVVTHLRGQMPDGEPMTELQAARLVEALGDERRKIANEWDQSGVTATTSFNSLGTMMIPSSAQSAEQKYNDATEYQRRQRERAAQVLTAGQLRVFTQTQEQMLDGFRKSWDNETRAAGNR